MGTTLIESRKRGADPSKLTVGEQRFVLELLAAGDGNLSAAVRKAFPKCKNPAQYGTKLMMRPRISAILGKIQREDVEELELDRHEVLRQLYYLITRSGADFFDKNGILILNHQVVVGARGKKEIIGSTIHDLPERAQMAIDGVKQKVKRYKLEDGTTVEEVETELKVSSKATAIEMGMKHKGLFSPDQLGITVSRGRDFLEELARPLPPDEIEGRLKQEQKKGENK